MRRNGCRSRKGFEFYFCFNIVQTPLVLSADEENCETNSSNSQSSKKGADDNTEEYRVRFVFARRPVTNL